METTKVANIHIYSDEKDMKIIQSLVKTLIPELSHLADEHWFHIDDDVIADWGFGQTDIFICEVGGEFHLTSLLDSLSSGLVIMECFRIQDSNMIASQMDSLTVYQWGKPYESVSLDQEQKLPQLQKFKFEIVDLKNFKFET